MADIGSRVAALASVRRAAADRCREVAIEIKEEAQNNLIRNGSFDTGDLLKSIEVTGSRPAARGGSFEEGIASANITIGEPYWKYVENGTGIYHEPDAHSGWIQTNSWGRGIVTHHLGQHAAPFLAPAIELVRSERLSGLL